MWRRRPWRRRWLAILSAVAGSCSKSFGESTPSRRPYRAHSSPNSPISPRLVKLPPLEGPARHIVHQTFWKNSIPDPLWYLPVQFCHLSTLFVPSQHRSTGFRSMFAPSQFCLPLVREVFPSQFFPMCHIRKKNAILRRFGSRCVTSGNVQHTAQGQDVQLKP